MGCPIHFLIFYTSCTQCRLMLRSWVPTKPNEVHWPLLPAAIGWQPENHGAFSYRSPSITPFLGLIQVQCMCLRTKQNKTKHSVDSILDNLPSHYRALLKRQKQKIKEVCWDLADSPDRSGDQAHLYIDYDSPVVVISSFICLLSVSLSPVS